MDWVTAFTLPTRCNSTKRRGYDVTVQVEENKLFVWKVAEVNIVQGGGLPDHPYLYPGSFDDLNTPDHDQNKVAFGLRHPVMPDLAEIGLTPEQAWDELCDIRLSAHTFISSEAHAEAERFLEGLPKPIICFHSRGTNWHTCKSLPTDVAFDLILKLMEQTGGSVVVLDFDERARWWELPAARELSRPGVTSASTGCAPCTNDRI
jgi:hypothetical protein